MPLVSDLRPGETEVLALVLESTDAVVVPDDALARQASALLNIRFRGTLGLLLDAKEPGLVSAIASLLDQLQASRFCFNSHTREAILALSGETP